MELPMFSASLGAMGSLAGKLDALLDTQLKDEIRKLTARLVKHSKSQDPPHTARYWVKDVLELSYEMQNCVDIEPDWIEKLSGFKARLKAANGRYDRYKLESIPMICTNFASDRQSRPMVDVQRRSSPSVVVVGLPADGLFDRLCLLLTDGHEQQLKVLSIVGVGGIGKTTLAKQLWREKKLGEFDCRAFVRTAKKPDMRRILRSILAQVRPYQPPEASEVHQLIHDIRQHLQDKRYFLIIDDLWATSVWDVVSHAFPEGNQYSAIVTTTEIDDVALACCSYQSKYIFKMGLLNFRQSKQLFTSIEFGTREKNYGQLDEALDEIVRRCAGLPLAIISIASVTGQEEADAVDNGDQTIERRWFWKWIHNFGYSAVAAFIQTYFRIDQIQQQKNSTTEGGIHDFVLKSLPTNTTSGEKMKQVLNVCYNSLPICLQTCLLYLSLYPENYTILKEDIMKQWVAEGFIRAPADKDKLKVAGGYFDNLVNMGLIQPIDADYSDEVSYYVVHHMVHDFITSKSIEENFVTVIDYCQRTIRLSNKVSRLSLQLGSTTHVTSPGSTTIGLSQVRSLAFFGLMSCQPSISGFKLLRSLILHVWVDQPSATVDLEPTSGLVLLRYLQVTCNGTVHLPDLVQGPKHLETLEINARVETIPANIVHLRNWFHLRLGVGTELPDLTGFLKNITQLNPPISLDESSSPPNTVTTIELLEPICSIPKWIGQLTNLCSLKVVVRELDDTSRLQGLPSLTVLSLYVQRATAEPTCFRTGGFTALDYLEFRCGVLRLTFEEGTLPNLQKLKLGFNARIGDHCGPSLIGIEHLKNVKDIVGIVGVAAGADFETADSTFKEAIGMHRSSKVCVRRADMVEEEYCGPADKKQGEHPPTSSEQPESRIVQESQEQGGPLQKQKLIREKPSSEQPGRRKQKSREGKSPIADGVSRSTNNSVRSWGENSWPTPTVWDSMEVIIEIESTAAAARQHKSKCLELAKRVNRLAFILPGLAHEIRNDTAMASVLERLKDALDKALSLIESCHAGFSLLMVNKYERKATEFDNVGKCINDCMMDLKLLSRNSRYPIGGAAFSTYAGLPTSQHVKHIFSSDASNREKAL